MTRLFGPQHGREHRLWVARRTKTRRAAPRGERTGNVTAGVRGTIPRRYSRSEMPFAAIWRLCGDSRPDTSPSGLAEGRRPKRRSGRCKPNARGLVGTEGTRDNKLVAEVGERHLLICGLRALRRSRHAGE